jgi:aminoglycoside phosphotransferase (APT) family kinase protein
MSDSETLEGIDRAKTEAWLGANIPSLEGPFSWKRLTGGTSNLTYALADANRRRVVLRRPPTGPLLPKAHDMGREFKILSALAPTPVPVATPFGMCTDESVTGAPFYVMDFCAGNMLRGNDYVVRPLPEAARGRVGQTTIDALAALHRLTPESVGLGDLGRPEAYVKRQLERWADSWARSNEAAKLDLPIQATHAELSKRIPEQGPARVVHGDYGPHNMLIDDDGEVVALTDWEISTLGDPLADLGYFVNNWSIESDETPYEEGRLAEGYATRGELLARYEEVSGRKLENLPFYSAFNYFKMACIIQGVYARFARGVRSSQGLDVQSLALRVESLVRSSERMLERL